MWSYLRNQRSRQTNLVYLQFLSNYALFSKNWYKKLLILLSYRLVGHQENFKIKLYYFRYYIILKLLSLFHMCF